MWGQRDNECKFKVICCSDVDDVSTWKGRRWNSSVNGGVDFWPNCISPASEACRKRVIPGERRLVCFLKGYPVTLGRRQASSPMMESICWLGFSGHFLHTPPVTHFQSSVFWPGKSWFAPCILAQRGSLPSALWGPSHPDFNGISTCLSKGRIWLSVSGLRGLFVILCKKEWGHINSHGSYLAPKVILIWCFFQS